MRIRSLVSLLTIIVSIFCQPLPAFANWGDFDTSFGFGGVTVDPVSGYAPRNVVIQPDGKILVTGYKTTVFGGKAFFLRRYLSNGALDTAFGSSGAAIGPETNTFGTDYRGGCIAILPNGRIAVAGWANSDHAVWQFTSTGIRDSNFGQSGLRILTAYPVLDNTYPELNIQSGKLLVTLKKTSGGVARVALVRLNSTGTTDSTFGTFGLSLTDLHGLHNSGTVIETDGKITIGGVNYADLSEKGLERKLANGQTDLSFSPTSAFSPGSAGAGLVKLANDKYATRVANIAGNGSVTLVLNKFSSAGVFESGVSLYNSFPSPRCPALFANQTDGKMLISGGDFIFRLNSDLETGTMETYDCSNIDGISSYHAAIQSDDKMVAAGNYNNYLILVRVLPD